jgi:very-short-patch-repair endonuclease
MVSNTHNAEHDSPSKIRGGGAIAPGALIVPDSKDDSSVAVSSCDINSPALTGTPSYPRGGVSRDTQHVMNTPEMKLFRRELRTHGTAAEGALWNILKRKQIAGLQFRRQYSVGTYILDFYCPALKLAIELDGDYHYHMDMPDRDWAREQELLNKHGIKTLRFENNIVFHDPETIRYYIMQELEYQQSKDSPK